MADLTESERARLARAGRINFESEVMAFEGILTARETTLRETIAQQIEALGATTVTNAQDDLIAQAAEIARGAS